jgi:hypothetical protein
VNPADLDALLELVVNLDDPGRGLPLDRWSVDGRLLTDDERALVRRADETDLLTLVDTLMVELARRRVGSP